METQVLVKVQIRQCYFCFFPYLEKDNVCSYILFALSSWKVSNIYGGMTTVSWSPIIPNQQPEMFCNYIILNKNQIAHIDWQLISLLFCGFNILGGSAGRESACNVGDLGSVPELGRCPGEGNGYPLQSSDLENSMNYTVHGIAKSQTQLSYFHTRTHTQCYFKY